MAPRRIGVPARAGCHGSPQRSPHARDPPRRTCRRRSWRGRHCRPSSSRQRGCSATAIEEAHALLVTEIGHEIVHARGDQYSHAEELTFRRLAQQIGPTSAGRELRLMCLIASRRKPFTPVWARYQRPPKGKAPRRLGIGEVHVGTHEVVVVAVIGVVHVLVPVLAVEEEHGRAPPPRPSRYHGSDASPT